MIFPFILGAIILRVYLVIRDSIPFAYDMGRDLLWAKDISFYAIPTLIGPAASIWGVYFQPFWYYFLSIPLKLAGGHPLSAVYTTMFSIVLAGALPVILFRKYLSRNYIFPLSVIILFNASLINLSTFAFHANLLPLLTLLVIFFCFLAIIKNPLYFSLAVGATSLMFSADPAPAVVFTILLALIFIFFKFYENKNRLKIILLSTTVYIIPFLPQILFEIRNDFIETKSLIAYFSGNNPSLSGQLPFISRFGDRLFLFFDLFKSGFTANNTILALIALAIIILGLAKATKNSSQNLKTILKLNLLFLVSSYLIFTILVTVEVKNWYLNGISVVYSFLVAIALTSFKIRNFSIALIFIFLLINIIPFFKNERHIKSRSDSASLSNQMTAINIIYGDSENEPFSVYVFTPSIYDHNYQYLFWWQAKSEDKKLPSDFAYSPNVPSYVRNKENYAKQKETSVIYLIIEKAPENPFYTKVQWLSQFTNYRLIFEKEIANAIILQKRVR